MRLILASSSITRREIMDKLNIPYDIVTADNDGISLERNPYKYAEELSSNKANAVYKKIGKGNKIIIAADSIIYKDGKKYEKPKTIEEAKENLIELSGSKNQGITGVTLIDTSNGNKITFSCVTNVYFKRILESDIDWYIQHEENILKKAGYSLDGIVSMFVEKLDGDYYNVLGLPLRDLYTNINRLGYSLKDLD